jgi:DUF917 family protein
LEAETLRTLSHQDLTDLVEGAAIFSAGGGGSSQIGHNIVERLVEDRCTARLIEPNEVPDDKIVINFACVGATASMGYRGEAALKTLVTLEEFLGKKAYAVIPVELGGFNTLTAVDVAARRGIPVVDADGAGRAVPEVQLKVCTIDEIPLAPMTIADVEARNIVIVKQTSDSTAAERIARTLATEWNQAIYTARRVLTGKQVKTSPVLGTLSKAMRLGMLLRKAVDPSGAVLKETSGFRLFEGKVDTVSHETKQGFTWTNAVLQGVHEDEGSMFEFKAKNAVLVAYKNGKLVAIAPDIITPIDFETFKGVAAEKLKKDDKLVIIGIPAPEKWRTPKGLEMWKETLKRSDVKEKYVEIEKLNTK